VAINKKRIRTGERGAGAEITDSDILTVLLLLRERAMGRYLLQRKLGLSESSTKSLLNYCRKKNLLAITSTRTGHSLSVKGKRIVSLMEEIIFAHGIFPYQLFKEEEHYFIFLSKKAVLKDPMTKKARVQPSWKFRDIAVAYGASAILLLTISNDGKELTFPEKELILAEHFPSLEEKIQTDYQEEMQHSSFLLIVSAKTIEVARKSSIICALTMNEILFQEILSLIN